MQYHYYSTHSGPFMLSTISHPMRCTKANREQACIKLRKARFSQLLNSSMKNYETQLKMYLKSFSRSYLGEKVNTAPFVCIPRFFSSATERSAAFPQPTRQSLPAPAYKDSVRIKDEALPHSVDKIGCRTVAV